MGRPWEYSNLLHGLVSGFSGLILLEDEKEAWSPTFQIWRDIWLFCPDTHGIISRGTREVPVCLQLTTCKVKGTREVLRSKMSSLLSFTVSSRKTKRHTELSPVLP